MAVKYSIIIPVYNSEEYLYECLESVRQQTFTDFECIVVDDGSKDKSLEIALGFAEKDKHFTVLHQENAGVSVARNNGLKNAKGENILFIDSDDTISKDYFDVIEKENKDCDLLMFQTSSSRIRKIGLIKVEDFYSAIDDSSVILAPWNKVWKKSVLMENNILFPVGLHYSEDMMFMLEYLCHIKNIKIIENEIYKYNIHSGSLSTGVKLEDYKKHIECCMNFFVVNGYEKTCNVYNFREQPVRKYIVAFSKYNFFDLMKFRSLHKKIREWFLSLPDENKDHLGRTFGKMALKFENLPYLLYLLLMRMKWILRKRK